MNARQMEYQRLTDALEDARAEAKRTARAYLESDGSAEEHRKLRAAAYAALDAETLAASELEGAR